MYFFSTSTHPYCPVYYKHHHHHSHTDINLHTHFAHSHNYKLTYTDSHIHVYIYSTILSYYSRNTKTNDFCALANNKLTIVDTTR